MSVCGFLKPEKLCWFCICDPAASIQDTEQLNSHDSEGSGGDCSLLMEEEGDAGWPSEALWKNLWVSRLLGTSLTEDMSSL